MIEPDVLETARRLQEWINSVDTLEYPQPVVLTFSDGVQSISVGDFCVWDSQGDSWDDLNVDTCRNKWQYHIRSLVPWLEELYIVQMPKPDEHGCTLYGVYTTKTDAESTVNRLNQTEPGHRALASIPNASMSDISKKRKRRKP